ncbi:hypothetical protein BDZ94DRAFT_194711 [Collybia nuda]|uniref:Uncharacterized protein n=1 Tax=Collybia nuda TaxID=64659 RepID=A0A9P5XXU3_9AGAR|nr:hypothetical protein BDZ94DRAFT_194711 [Collybia nuda]
MDFGKFISIAPLSPPSSSFSDSIQKIIRSYDCEKANIRGLVTCQTLQPNASITLNNVARLIRRDDESTRHKRRASSGLSRISDNAIITSQLCRNARSASDSIPAARQTSSGYAMFWRCRIYSTPAKLARPLKNGPGLVKAGVIDDRSHTCVGGRR